MRKMRRANDKLLSSCGGFRPGAPWLSAYRFCSLSEMSQECRWGCSLSMPASGAAACRIPDGFAATPYRISLCTPAMPPNWNHTRLRKSRILLNCIFYRVPTGSGTPPCTDRTTMRRNRAAGSGSLYGKPHLKDGANPLPV